MFRNYLSTADALVCVIFHFSSLSVVTVWLFDSHFLSFFTYHSAKRHISDSSLVRITLVECPFFREAYGWLTWTERLKVCCKYRTVLIPWPVRRKAAWNWKMATPPHRLNLTSGKTLSSLTSFPCVRLLLLVLGILNTYVQGKNCSFLYFLSSISCWTMFFFSY